MRKAARDTWAGHGTPARAWYFSTDPQRPIGVGRLVTIERAAGKLHLRDAATGDDYDVLGTTSKLWLADDVVPTAAEITARVHGRPIHRGQAARLPALGHQRPQQRAGHRPAPQQPVLRAGHHRSGRPARHRRRAGHPPRRASAGLRRLPGRPRRRAGVSPGSERPVPGGRLGRYPGHRSGTRRRPRGRRAHLRQPPRLGGG